MVGYINRDTNLVDKVQTWLDNEFFGDMLIEADYLYYRDNNGLKFPARIVQQRGGWPTFEMYVLGCERESCEPPAADDASRGGAAARQAAPAGAPAGAAR